MRAPITGGNRDNTLTGGRGNDHVIGAGGDDFLYRGEGNDRRFGGLGSDTLFGGHGRDLFDGSGSQDILYGGDGKDIAKDGCGSDFIGASRQSERGTGTNNLWGGKGADTFLIEDNASTLRIVIHDLTRQDTIRFNDRTWGDRRDLLHDFDDLLAAARNTCRGVTIDLPDGAESLLRGDKLNDLLPQMFDFFAAAPE